MLPVPSSDSAVKAQHVSKNPMGYSAEQLRQLLTLLGIPANLVPLLLEAVSVLPTLVPSWEECNVLGKGSKRSYLYYSYFSFILDSK
jgi:hypothetical protein